MIRLIQHIRKSWYHAAYHRNMKKAINARKQQNILQFKKYIYQAEDAWRKLVIITEKTK